MTHSALIRKTILMHKLTGDVHITEDKFTVYRKTHPKVSWEAKPIRDIDSQYTTVCYGDQMLANPSRARRILKTELPKTEGTTVEIRPEQGNLGRMTMTKTNKGYLVRHYWPASQAGEARYGEYEWPQIETT